MISNIYDSGVNIILYLQGVGSWLIDPMKWITYLGDENFFVLFAPVLYWCIDTVLGLRFGILLMLSNGLNAILKFAFHSPRPFWYSAQVRAYVTETSFGVPSGHAMNAASTWGLVAVSVRRMWSWLVLVLLILLIGFSRVVLGVHFPVDVVAGWIFGLLLLWIFLLLETPVLAWLGSQGLGTQVWTAFTASVVLIVTGWLVKNALAGFQIPDNWIVNASAVLHMENPIEGFSLSGLITSAGAFFGLAAGAIGLRALGGFDVSGSWWVRLVRYPIGLVGVLVLWYGLGLVFPRGEHVSAYALRYVRYFLVGFWVTGLAPLAFVSLGLAKGKEE
jgi:membrane-associated phospholipid phosphatase